MPCADQHKGYPYNYASAKGRDKLYDQILAAVHGTEEKIVRAKSPGDEGLARGMKLPLTPGDVAFLVEEMYNSRSAISGIPTRCTLSRWRAPEHDTLMIIGEGSDEQKSAKLKLSELVCMTRDEAVIHQRDVVLGGKKPEDLYDKDVIERVESRLKDIQRVEEHRY